MVLTCQRPWTRNSIGPGGFAALKIDLTGHRLDRDNCFLAVQNPGGTFYATGILAAFHGHLVGHFTVDG